MQHRLSVVPGASAGGKVAEKEQGESELGRSKHASTPAEHLRHLLNIGWKQDSPLLQKFVMEHNLQRELEYQVQERKRF